MATTKPKKKKAFTPQDAITYAKALISTSVPTDAQKDTLIQQISEKLQNELPSNAFPPQAIAAMASEIYTQASSQLQKETDASSALSQLSPSDLTAVHTLFTDNATALWTTIESNPDGLVFVPGTDPLVSLLIAITAHALTAYHPSHWMRYDRKEIFSIAGLQKLPASAQEELIQDVHTLFNLDMRVIGSNQPIPCYTIPWLVPPSSDATVSVLHRLDPHKVATSLYAIIADLSSTH